jgi:hypothetical protein
MLHLLHSDGISASSPVGCCDDCVKKHEKKRDHLVLCTATLRRASILQDVARVIVGMMAQL